MSRTILLFSFFLVFSSIQAQSLQWQWAKQYGGTGHDMATNTAVDDAGNVFTIGIFHDTISIGGQSIVSNGQSDLFISKHDELGNVLWVKRFGGNGNEYAQDIVLSTSGAIYIAGYYRGQSIFGPFISGSATSVFVTKLDAAGNIIWTRSELYGSSYKFEGLALDADQNLVLAGMANEKVIFGLDTVSVTSTATNPFYASFDTSGNTRWLNAPQAKSSSGPLDLAADKYGNFYTIGQSSDSIIFSATEALPKGIFITKHRANGNVVWARNMTGAYATGSGIAVDEEQNIYIGGKFEDTGRIGNLLLTGFGATNFLGALDSNGNAVWAQTLSSTSHESQVKLIVGSENHIVATGNFTGSMRMGNVMHSYPQKKMPFILKLDKSGNFVWGDKLLANNLSSPINVGAGKGNEVYITGSMGDSLHCGTTRLTGAGSDDIFLAKLSTAPSLIPVIHENKPIKLYPQPSAGNIILEFQPNEFQHLVMTDQLGRFILQKEMPDAEVAVRLDLTQLQTGIYGLRLIGKEKSISRKVVIIH